MGVAAAVLLLRGAAAPSPEAEARRPDLRAADLVGCYEVRVGPWSFDPDRVRESPDDPPSKRELASTVSSLSPPTRVILFPDSADRWGRDLQSRRAVSVRPPGEAPRERDLRWTARADTLWLVWSEGETRAGVALFAAGDSFVGAARSLTGPLDGRAGALAWRVNCGTLERVPPREAPRR